MQRREGRMAHPELEAAPGARHPPLTITPTRNWERWLFVLALIAILMLGAVGGLNALIGIYTN